MGSMAVIGAGNVGQAIAAHMTIEGHDVRLYSPWEAEFAHIVAHGGVELSGEVVGLGLPGLMTTDLVQAVAGADVVLVAVPAFAHRSVSEQLAAVVEPEQLVLFQPSALGSGLELSNHFARAGRKPCLIAETGTSLYTCRLQRPAHVFVGKIKPSVKVGATPCDAIGEVRLRLAPYFDDRFAPETDALTVGLSRIGAVYHVPPALFNFKTVEDGIELPHNTLATPRISEVIERLDAERLALSSRLGVRAMSFREFLTRSYGVSEGTLSERIQRSYGPLNFPEPNSPTHRYFAEDIPFSMAVWSSLAQQIGLAMPLTDAVIDIGSVLCGRDWRSEARTAADLGLLGATADRIHETFATGASASTP